MTLQRKKNVSRVLSLLVFAGAVLFLIYLENNKLTFGMAVATMQKSLIFAIVATSMNLLNGFTGLFSLGQAGFMALGAYITGILTIPTKTIESVYYMSGVSPFLMDIKRALDVLPTSVLIVGSLILGGLVAALFAFLLGIPVLRLKSDYLAIATLGFAEIVRAIISSPQLDMVTNGSYGLKSIAGLGNTVTGRGTLLVPFFAAVLCIGFMVLVVNSSYGRAFKAIREDETAAEAMGINLFRHKQMSFVLSSFFAGISGGLLAMFMRSIEAKTFSIMLTYDILLIVVIGGLGSISGSIIGAFLVTFSKEWWLRFFDQPLFIGDFQVPLVRTGFRMVLFSVLLMVVVLFYRRGLMGRRELSFVTMFGWPEKWRQKRLKRKLGADKQNEQVKKEDQGDDNK